MFILLCIALDPINQCWCSWFNLLNCSQTVSLGCGATCLVWVLAKQIAIPPRRCGRLVSSVLLHKVQIENYWKMPVRATTLLISSVAVTVFALQGHVCSCIKSSSVKVTNAKYLSARAFYSVFLFLPFWIKAYFRNSYCIECVCTAQNYTRS